MKRHSATESESRFVTDSAKIKSNIFNTTEKIYNNIIDLKDYVDFIENLGFAVYSSDQKIGRKRVIWDQTLKFEKKTFVKDIKDIGWFLYSKDEVVAGHTLPKREEALNNFIENKTFYEESIEIYSICKHHLNCQKSNRSHKKIIKEHTDVANICYKIEKTYGLSRSSRSNVIAFDIDSHPKEYTPDAIKASQIEAQRTLNILLKTINKIPCYMESSKNGGFHVYFRLDGPITEETQKHINKWIKMMHEQHNIHLETNSILKVFQLPFSTFYEAGIMNGEDGISGYFQPISLEDAIYFCTFLKTECPENNLSRSFFGTEEKEQSNPAVSFIPSEEIVYNHCYYNNQYNSNKKIFDNNELPFYGAGQRIQIWYHEGGLYKFYKASKGNFTVFGSLLQQYDIGSKDMKSNSARTIQEGWDWISSKSYIDKTAIQTTSTPDQFISNKKFIEENYAHLIPVIKQLSKFYQESYYPFYTKQKRKEQLLSILEHILYEVIGRIIFEKESNFQRIISDTTPLTNKMKKELTKGFIFYFPQLSSYLRSLYPSMNIEKIIRIFNKHNFFLHEYKQHLNLPYFKIQKRYKFNNNISIENLYSYFLLKLKNFKDMSMIYYYDTQLYVKVFSSLFDKMTKNYLINLFYLDGFL